MPGSDDEAAGALKDKLLSGFSKLRQQPRGVSGALEARKAREAIQSGPEIDGRRRRANERTVQFNLRVTPAFKKRALPGADDYEQIPALAERGRARVQQFFKMMDARLADNAFIAGARYTVADITTLVAVDFAGWIKLAIPEACPHLVASTYEADSSSERIARLEAVRPAGDGRLRGFQSRDCGIAFRVIRRFDRKPRQSGTVLVALSRAGGVPDIAADMMVVAPR